MTKHKPFIHWNDEVCNNCRNNTNPECYVGPPNTDSCDGFRPFETLSMKEKKAQLKKYRKKRKPIKYKYEWWLIPDELKSEEDNEGWKVKFIKNGKETIFSLSHEEAIRKIGLGINRGYMATRNGKHDNVYWNDLKRIIKKDDEVVLVWRD